MFKIQLSGKKKTLRPWFIVCPLPWCKHSNMTFFKLPTCHWMQSWEERRRPLNPCEPVQTLSSTPLGSEKGKKPIQGHTDGWFPSQLSFLFITEQSRNWASGSLYFKKQKRMHICKVTQKKGLGTPAWWKRSPVQAGGGATLLLHGLVHTCAYILELLSHMWHQFWVWGEDLTLFA